ncbi:triose-phosphate isomerase [Candidatus Bathyarchaeota archaeon]|nr:triose-phosphate isomerase [Candidatus Bathyarchaeota archaeon]
MSLQEPLIIVNFKTYLESAGKNGLNLARQAKKASKETGIQIVICPQLADLSLISATVDIPIFSQHIDAITPGSHTGHVLATSIKDAGAIGTLINHSERQLKLSEIDSIIKITKKNNLLSCVCVNNPSVSGAVSALNPDIVSIEPPELIGTGVAVSKAKPEIVTNTINIVHKINNKPIILCGAGISKPEDVSVAIKLGTKGILVASAIVKAKNPYDLLCKFAEAIIIA